MSQWVSLFGLVPVAAVCVVVSAYYQILLAVNAGRLRPTDTVPSWLGLLMGWALPEGRKPGGSAGCVFVICLLNAPFVVFLNPSSRAGLPGALVSAGVLLSEAAWLIWFWRLTSRLRREAR